MTRVLLITVSNNVTKHSSTSTLQGAHETHTNDDKQIEIVKVTYKTTHSLTHSLLRLTSEGRSDLQTTRSSAHDQRASASRPSSAVTC